jgi:hypothetical protein
MSYSRYALSFLAAATVAGVVLTSSEAQAQQPPAPVAAAAPGGSDHAQVSNTFGVGYLGLNSIQYGAGLSSSVSAPIVGVRYWLNEGMGIDVGVGLGLTGGSSKNKSGSTETTTDSPSTLGAALHFGVPLVLGTTGAHHTFQVVPEVNLGYASSSKKEGEGDATIETKNSGLRLDAGVRAGTEVHFGFMGLPRLSLQATVGLYLSYLSGTTTTKQGTNETENSSSGYGLGTTVQNQPWSIFTQNVAAIYYF